MPELIAPDTVGLAAQPTVDALDAWQPALVIGLNRQHHGIGSGHDVNLVWVFAIKGCDLSLNGRVLLLVQANEGLSTQFVLALGQGSQLTQ